MSHHFNIFIQILTRPCAKLAPLTRMEYNLLILEHWIFLVVARWNVHQCRVEFVIVIVEPEVRMINSLFSEFHQIMATSSCYLTHHHKSTQSWCLNSSLTIARLFLNIKILLMSEFIGCEIIMKLLIKLLAIISQERSHQNCRQYVRNGFRRKPTHA